ncbi:hypothetical protein GCM10007877_25020 [Marinibactrum halimedae]|uniref:Uncharacterized protein n=1 Tax=Marinibactrum halimedae TaxID=1444977 RepID=A0AA37T473_9GAMM|nr:hypothetical protein GCM10007877_25020 [Marinibactrum halimedae]
MIEDCVVGESVIWGCAEDAFSAWQNKGANTLIPLISKIENEWRYKERVR